MDADAIAVLATDSAEQVLNEFEAKALLHDNPSRFWRGFVHALLGGLVKEIGEAEVMALLNDALVVIPIAAADVRGDIGKH